MARLWEAVARFKRGILLDEMAAPSTPSSGQMALYSNTSGVPYVKDDAGNTSSLANNIPIPFYIDGTISTGIKNPEFIAPVAMTIISMLGRCGTSSVGTVYRPSKNGGSADGTASSATTTSVVTTAQSLSLAAGDRLALNITTAGTSTNLSVTFWARVT